VNISGSVRTRPVQLYGKPFETPTELLREYSFIAQDYLNSTGFSHQNAAVILEPASLSMRRHFIVICTFEN